MLAERSIPVDKFNFSFVEFALDSIQKFFGIVVNQTISSLFLIKLRFAKVIYHKSDVLNNFILKNWRLLLQKHLKMHQLQFKTIPHPFLVVLREEYKMRLAHRRLLNLLHLLSRYPRHWVARPINGRNH